MNKTYFKKQIFTLFLGAILTCAPHLSLGTPATSCNSLFNPSETKSLSGTGYRSKEDLSSIIKQANKENAGIEIEGIYNTSKTTKLDVVTFIINKLYKEVLSEKDFIKVVFKNGAMTSPLTIQLNSSNRLEKLKEIKIFREEKIKAINDLIKKYPSINKESFYDDIYEISYLENNLRHAWEVKHDPSFIKKKDMQKELRGIEITSPILKNKKQRKLFYKTIKEIETEFSIKNNPDTGGIHIHLDRKFSYFNDGHDAYTDGHDAYMFFVFKSLFIVDQSLFEFFIGRNNKRHIKTFQYSSKTNYLTSFSKDLSLEWYKKTENPPPSNKIHMPKQFLILKSLLFNRKDVSPLFPNDIENKSTWEFRLFNSTLNPKEIEFETEFVTRLFAAAKIEDQKLIDFTKKYTHFSSTGVLDLFKILFTEKELDDYLTAKQKEKLGLKQKNKPNGKASNE